jgi:hypothetical protein
MAAFLPKRVVNKVSFLFIIICPPLITVVIGELIKRKMKEKEKEKEQ